MDSEKLIYLYIKVDYRNVLFYRFTSIIGIHNHWLSFYVLQNLHCLIKRWFYKMLLTVPLTNLDLYGLNTLFSFMFFFLKFMNLITNHCWVTFRRYCKGVYSTSLVKCVSVERLLMEAWDTNEEELELWGIELQKVHLYEQLKARWYSVQMFSISKNSLESHLFRQVLTVLTSFLQLGKLLKLRK